MADIRSMATETTQEDRTQKKRTTGQRNRGQEESIGARGEDTAGEDTGGAALLTHIARFPRLQVVNGVAKLDFS